MSQGYLLNMPNDPRPDKNLKITDFTTKTNTTPQSDYQSRQSQKRLISTLSPSSPDQDQRRISKEAMPTTAEITAPETCTNGSSQVSTAEENASLQKALGPLIKEFR